MKKCKLLIVILLLGCTPKKNFEQHYSGRLSSSEMGHFLFSFEKIIPPGIQTEFLFDTATLRIKESPTNDTETSAPKLFLDSKIAEILKIYAIHDTPYAGILSKNITCAEEYVPREIKTTNNQLLRSVLVYANERMVLGSCSRDTAKLKTLYMVLLCPQHKKNYEFTLFVPLENGNINIENIAKNLKCL